ncbi:GntR family transcriptional regulator [Variovorax paradoxus]|uniref:GntR family transcriptional regulator n=1 Tax=Variovorax paradoxus TaxID=34073 RepID=UPI003ECF9FD0
MPRSSSPPKPATAPRPTRRKLPPTGGAAAKNEGNGDIEERIFRSVFESVASQRLAPGTKLPEASLCELFGVSRALVRKVLQRLAHDHVVELRPNRGAIVAMPSPEETRQIFEARRALEAALVRMAVRNATRAEVAELRRHLKQEHAAMHRYAQPEWARLASTFHLRVAKLARNPILERYLSELMSRCSLIVALYEPPGNASCEHGEHADVVDAIARGDADEAVRLMEAHLLVLEKNIALDRPASGRSLGQMLGLG